MSEFEPLTRRRVLGGVGAFAAGTALPGVASGTPDPSDVLDAVDAGEELQVGVARRTLAWRAGATPGQVGTGTGTGLTDEPYAYSTVSEPGDGIHSEPTVTAIVIEQGGERHALVKADMYLMHRYVHRRVAELVADVGIARDRLLLQASHNHSAPHTVATGAAVAAFTDVFDVRHWSYVTRHVAGAVTDAVDALEPAAIGAVKGSFDAVQRNIIGPAQATTMAREESGPLGARRTDRQHEPIHDADGDPVMAGFPEDHVDDTFVVIRFDRPDGSPIAAAYSVGMHPESLENGHGLTTAEYVGRVERALESRVGEEFTAIWLNGALGDVEPAEGDRPGTRDWWRESFASMEDMASRVVPAAHRLWELAGRYRDDAGPPIDPPRGPPDDTPGETQRGPPGGLGDPDGARGPDPVEVPTGETVVPVSRDVRVRGAAIELPPPEDRPFGPSSSYVSQQGGSGLEMPSTGAAQESMNARLGVLALGNVLLAGFPGEPITDCARNFRSRVDDTEDGVYQGYHWPDEPDWVHERIESNFATDALDPDEGFPVSVMLSITNDWLGYFVTRWEYENRNHYRQSLTPYGPESADYVVSTLVDLAREARGGPPASLPSALAEGRRTAEQGRTEAFYRGLVAAEGSVRAFRASIPPAPDAVGEPRGQPRDVTRFETATFSWVGGSNAVDLPRPDVQRLVDGEWVTVADGSSGAVVTVKPQEQASPETVSPREEEIWTARFEVPWDAPAGTYRFRVTGEARGETPDVGERTFFDPTGADEPYEVVSDPFRIDGGGAVPVRRVDVSGGRLRLRFEPSFRNCADPPAGTEIAVTVDGTTQTATADGTGEFAVALPDRGDGEASVVVDRGAWVDPAGNPTARVETTVQR